MNETTRTHLIEMRSGNLAIYWVLKGAKGVVAYHLLIHKSHIPEHYRETPIDICTHSLNPQYPGHVSYGLCEFLDNGVCYGVDDHLSAEALWANIQNAPRTMNTVEIIWKELERKYAELL